MEFRRFQPDDRAQLRQMIFQLYEEDPDGEPISDEKIDRTISELSRHPQKGRLMVFVEAGEIVGYSILINYWSNEFGGNVLNIDELFVKEAWRSRGIGSRFIDSLCVDTENNAVALELEVNPSNHRARACYERLGFESSDSLHLSRLI